MKVNFGSDLFSTFANNTAPTVPEQNTGVQQSTTVASVAAQAPKQDTYQPQKAIEKVKSPVLDSILKYSGIAALAATPIGFVAMHKLNKKQFTKTTDAVIKNMENILDGKLQKVSEESSKKIDKLQSGSVRMWKGLALFAGGMKLADFVEKQGNDPSDQAATDSYHDEIIQKVGEKIQNIDNGINESKNIASDAKNTAVDAKNTADYAKAVRTKGPLHSKYLESVFGFELLKGVDKKAGFNQTKYDSAVQRIQSAAPDLLAGKIQDNKEPLKVGDTVWSITSEFAPMKEGGLGVVPVDLQNNFEKLGVKTPTFIPMYQKNGHATLRNINGKYSYNYNGTIFNLDKVAEYRVHSYRRNDSKDEPVEVFVSTSKMGTKKVDGKDVPVEILTAPLVFLKNDEYFNGSIYAKTAKSDEPEKFAFFAKSVYELAKAKFDPNSVKGMKIINQEKYENIAAPNGLMLNDWQASPIAALARYKAPMENAYGGLNDDAEAKLENMKIMTIGHNAQYQGATHLDNSYEQKIEVSENILNTLFDNFASDIVKNAKTGSEYDSLSNSVILDPDSGDRHVNFLNMGICLSDYFAPVSKNYAKELVDDPMKSGYLQWAVGQRDKSNTLIGIINGNDIDNLAIGKKVGFIKKVTGSDFKVYTQDSPKEEVMAARLENKIKFYNEFMSPICDGSKKASGLEVVGKTELPKLSDEEIAQTPIISFAHRLVSQKGAGTLSGAIKNIYENWEKEFPGKPKPIFYIGGEDGEGGAQRKIIEELKANLKPEDSNRVMFAHGFNPNPAIMSATDYFLMPSNFEPCGLTQSEAFAFGTPVIATATGGIVDTVVAEGDSQTGILSKEINAEGFGKAIKEGLNIFYDDKSKYENMCMNALHQDFSWIQPNKEGPIYDYLDKFGLKREDLPEKADVA